MMHFWNDVFVFLKTEVQVFILLGMVYSYGATLSILFKCQQKQEQSYHFIVGLFTLSLCGWLAYSMQLNLNLALKILLIIPIAFFLLVFTKLRKPFIQNFSIPWLVQSFSVTSITCLLFCLITSSSHPQSIISYGNHDLYNWSILADYLKTGHGFANIFTHGTQFIHDNIENGFGTYFFMALVSQFLNMPTMESSSYLLILVSTIYVLVCKDILQKYFSIQQNLALFLSIMCCFCSFLFTFYSIIFLVTFSHSCFLWAFCSCAINH